MGCLYLHIGTPKTGTSSIQFFLGKNRKVLESKGYCFPKMKYRFEGIGKNRNAHFMVQRYYDENKKRLYEQEENLRNEGMHTVLEYLSRYEHVILSDESLWTQSCVIKDFWENLYRVLSEQGHTLKVIVYLRRQDDYIRSNWAQLAKEGTLSKNFAEYIASESWRRRCVDYISELDAIASIIGQENIIVRPFERGQFLKQDLYTDFLDSIGLSLTEEYNCNIQDKNNAVAGEYLQIKQILNQNPAFTDKKGFMLALINNATMRHDGKADYRRATIFPGDGPACFLKEFEEGNKIVAQKYLNRKDGVLFYDSPEGEVGLKPYTKEELILACGDIILELESQIESIRLSQKSIRAQWQVMEKLLKRRVKRTLKKKK